VRKKGSLAGLCPGCFPELEGVATSRRHSPLEGCCRLLGKMLRSGLELCRVAASFGDFVLSPPKSNLLRRGVSKGKPESKQFDPFVGTVPNSSLWIVCRAWTALLGIVYRQMAPGIERGLFLRKRSISLQSWESWGDKRRLGLVRYGDFAWERGLS